MKASRRGFLSSLPLALLVGMFLPKKWAMGDGCPGTTYGIGSWTNNGFVDFNGFTYYCVGDRIWISEPGKPLRLVAGGRPKGAA